MVCACTCGCACRLCSSKSNCEHLKLSLLKRKILSSCGASACLPFSPHVSLLSRPLPPLTCSLSLSPPCVLQVVWRKLGDAAGIKAVRQTAPSLGTSSKGLCSPAAGERWRGKEREREMGIYSTCTHLKTPLTTRTHNAVLPTLPTALLQHARYRDGLR